jgi:phage-related protein
LKRQAVETIYKDATSYTITNPGNEPAYPKLIITGAGAKTVAIGTHTITISFATLGETITIDALNGQIYDGDGNNAWNKISGDLPMIPVSASAITISTTASALTIYPNWRWS